VGVNPLGGDHMAFVDNVRITSSPVPGFGIEWLVTDQLGTPRMVFDKTGALASVKRHDYLPFGEEIFAGTGGRTTNQGYGAADTLRQQFTAEERDVETGLDYFIHRYYSSVQGRFTSTDPLMSRRTVFNPQRWNRYSYVVNNPLKFVDLLGLQDAAPVVDKDAKKPKKVTDTRGRKYEMVLVRIRPWNEPRGGGNSSFSTVAMTSSGGSGGSGGRGSAHFLHIQAEEPPPEEAMPETEAEREEEEFARERMEAGEPLDLETGADLIEEVDRALAAEEARMQSEIRIAAVLNETLNGTGDFTSQYQLTPEEALEAGFKLVGENYTELGKPGSGVFRSADGQLQFRMDFRSLMGLHPPNTQHVHFEVFAPGARYPAVNNHVIILDPPSIK
jgi:RHS repeat-associated protein